jgi:hypothetical protein
MNDARLLIDAINANPLEPTPRKMLADWCHENGLTESARQIASGHGWILEGYDGDGDGGGGGGGYDGDGGDGGGGGGGGYDGDGGGGDGGDGGGGGYDGYGGDGGDGGGGGYGGGGIFKFSTGYIMTAPGLYIVCTAAGYYPYVRIAWCRRADDQIVMTGARVLKQFGSYVELSRLAVEGPVSSTKLLTASKLPSGCSAGIVTRWEACEPAAWAKECPKPKGWDDE